MQLVIYATSSSFGVDHSPTTSYSLTTTPNHIASALDFVSNLLIDDPSSAMSPRHFSAHNLQWHCCINSKILNTNENKKCTLQWSARSHTISSDHSNRILLLCPFFTVLLACWLPLYFEHAKYTSSWNSLIPPKASSLSSLMYLLICYFPSEFFPNISIWNYISSIYFLTLIFSITLNSHYTYYMLIHLSVSSH